MTTPTSPPALRDNRPSGRRKSPPASEVRSEFERDLDRVIYDYYFRRLADVTQISSGTGKILQHNRMTHSLKVAQVGRRLVQYLWDEQPNRPGITRAGGIDADVVEAAGLLHDAGHPPFGHIAEQQLDAIARQYGLLDGFEGNAQTLRIIASLGHHRGREQQETDRGLDLTCAVTAACVKYPWEWQDVPGRRKKWGVYTTESAFFGKHIRPLLPDDGVCTLEAQVMNWADDITYAVHDLQDFYLDGLIPLHALRHTSDGRRPVAVNEDEMNYFWAYATEKLRNKDENMPDTPNIRQMFAGYAVDFPGRAYGGTREEKAAIGQLASRIITDASIATSVKQNGRLYVRPEMQALIGVLKEITWFYVIDKPELVSVQNGQRRKIDELFRRLLEWVGAGYDDPVTGNRLSRDERWIRQRRLPVALLEFINPLREANNYEGIYGHPGDLVRGTIDYIASMTELELDDMYLRLTSGDHLPLMAARRLD